MTQDSKRFLKGRVGAGNGVKLVEATLRVEVHHLVFALGDIAALGLCMLPLGRCEPDLLIEDIDRVRRAGGKRRFHQKSLFKADVICCPTNNI
jgi:hypothetical protein